MADLKDCELVKKATSEERMKLLSEMAEMGGDDHRGRYAKHVLSQMPTTA